MTHSTSKLIRQIRRSERVRQGDGGRQTQGRLRSASGRSPARRSMAARATQRRTPSLSPLSVSSGGVVRREGSGRCARFRLSLRSKATSTNAGCRSWRLRFLQYFALAHLSRAQHDMRLHIQTDGGCDGRWVYESCSHCYCGRLMARSAIAPLNAQSDVQRVVILQCQGDQQMCLVVGNEYRDGYGVGLTGSLCRINTPRLRREISAKLARGKTRRSVLRH
jgi:hypothetical protein